MATPVSCVHYTFHSFLLYTEMCFSHSVIVIVSGSLNMYLTRIIITLNLKIYTSSNSWQLQNNRLPNELLHGSYSLKAIKNKCGQSTRLLIGDLNLITNQVIVIISYMSCLLIMLCSHFQKFVIIPAVRIDCDDIFNFSANQILSILQRGVFIDLNDISYQNIGK